jgi:hypothetical protein
VTENSSDVEAALALHIHEEGIGRLDKTLELVLPLLKLSRWVKQIDIVLKNHLRKKLKRRRRKIASNGNNSSYNVVSFFFLPESVTFISRFIFCGFPDQTRSYQGTMHSTKKVLHIAK